VSGGDHSDACAVPPTISSASNIFVRIPSSMTAIAAPAKIITRTPLRRELCLNRGRQILGPTLPSRSVEQFTLDVRL